MELLEELKTHFVYSLEDRAYKLSSIDNNYPAWVVRFNGEFGVAVPYEGDKVNEEFANARIYSKELLFKGKLVSCLVLISETESTRNEFAIFCADFVEPGENGIKRKELLEAPVLWWKKWKRLIGNAIVEKQPYAVLGELITFYYLIGKGINPKWMGPKRASNDIIADDSNNEVKSTISRYGKNVKISGQFQMQSKNLYLYFLRFEKNQHGISINDMLDKLVNVGQDEYELNCLLKKLGYNVGNSARDEKYNLLEMLKYTVDRHFPKIIPESFVGGSIPNGISQISYFVNLDTVPSTTVEFDLEIYE